MENKPEGFTLDYAFPTDATNEQRAAIETMLKDAYDSSLRILGKVTAQSGQ